MAKLVKLEIVTGRKRHDRDPRITQVDCDHAAPFFINRRGILAHRVQHLYQLTAPWGRGSWWIVKYWCENSGRGDEIDDDLQFDPGDRLVCSRCEANAVARGQATSSELAGRHVCVGKLRAVNVCCQQESN